MSKQSEAKERQGYVERPVPQTCANCRNYGSDFVTRKHAFGEWTDEKNRRCTLGGFAVKKQATCKLWQPNETRDAK